MLVEATVIKGTFSSPFIEMSAWLFPEKKRKKNKLTEKKNNVTLPIHDTKFHKVVIAQITCG